MRRMNKRVGARTRCGEGSDGGAQRTRQRANGRGDGGAAVSERDNGVPPCRWELPPATAADAHGIVGFGADLEPGTLVAAYRSGLFPMRVNGGALPWWSPDPRG